MFAILALALSGKALGFVYTAVRNGESVTKKAKSEFINTITTALSFLFALAILAFIYTYGENIVLLMQSKQ